MKHVRTVVSPANLVTLARLLLAPVLFALVLDARDAVSYTHLTLPTSDLV